MFFNPYRDEDPKNRADRLRARYEQLRETEMSSWYSITDLFHTVVDISLSEVFRSRLDRRMLQPPEPVPLPRPDQPEPSAATAASDQPTARSEATQQTAQNEPPRTSKFFDYSQSAAASQAADGAFWFDFAADVGDGFNSTYYVAALLSQPTLYPQDHDPADQATTTTAKPSQRAPGSTPQAGLPRGRFLLLGGDEVYPSASRESYEQRFCRVYEAAAYADRPPKADDATHLFALPGNHDWYDGLASFMQVFGDERAIGMFRTRQRSSYFAIKLPHGFWIFAIDIGLWGELDRRQVEYFQDLAENDLADGDRIILCIAEPDWVKARPNIENLRDGLFYFERRLAEALERAAQRDHANESPTQNPSPAATSAQQAPRKMAAKSPLIPRRNVRVVLRLAGDLHHYRRHESIEPFHPTDRSVQDQDFVPHGYRLVHNLTAGGGGAFLHPTHEVDRDRRSKLGGQLAHAADGTVTQFPPGFYKLTDTSKQDQPIDETRQDCLVFQCQHAFPSVEESRRQALKNLAFFRYNPLFLLSLIVVYGALLNLGLYLLHIQHHLWTALLVFVVSLGFLKGCQGYAKGEASGEIGESKQGRQRQIYRRRSVLHKAGNRGLWHGAAHAAVFVGSLFSLAFVYHQHFAPPEGCSLGIGECMNGCIPILSDLSELWDRQHSGRLWFWLQEASCTADFSSMVRFVLAAAFGVLGAWASTVVFGVYLFLALNKSHLKLHANGAFASLRIQDYKNFLRIRVTQDGLTVYPIGIRKVPRKWDLRIPNDPSTPPPAGPPQTSLFYPAGSDRSAPFYDQLTRTAELSTPFLIEPPIVIPKADP